MSSLVLIRQSDVDVHEGWACTGPAAQQNVAIIPGRLEELEEDEGRKDG